MTALVRIAAALLPLGACGCAPSPPAAAAGAATSGSVPVVGGTVAYREAGAGPALVLHHGGGIDNSMWNALVPRLAERHRVIAWDARGHGRSTAPAGPQPQMTEDLLRLLDALDISKATLVGFSMGGERHPALR